jgi:HSP20 family protein
MNYHRVFSVAESVAADRISAELKVGVLTVRLPKIEAVKPRRIAVTG